MSFVSSAGTAGTQHNEQALDFGAAGDANTDQFIGVFASGTINFGGFNNDGRPFDEGISLPVDQSSILTDIIGHLNNNILDEPSDSFSEGRIQITDDPGGSSKTDTIMIMSFSNEDPLATGSYFEALKGSNGKFG